MLQLPPADELAAWVREERERWHVPGMVVGLARGNELITAASGVCELGEDAPVEAGTLFRIASITKPFVATLAMTFVEEGRLALDEELPAAHSQATLRQLLSHQSGLASEWSSPVDPGDRADDALERLLAAGEPVSLPIGPGELFSYCNVGFWFVGAAIARLAGAPFEDAMRERVLEPLGLRHTTFEPPAGAATARGHNQVAPGADEHRPADDAYPRARRPSGGLWSSVKDLLRFAAHQLGGPGPLSAASLEELRRPQVSTGDGSYGLGWATRGVGSRRIVEHGGSTAGYESLLLLLPEESFALAALTNSSRGSAAIRELQDRLGVGPQERPDFAISDEERTLLAGCYRGQDLEVSVSVEGTGLRIDVVDHDTMEDRPLVFPPMYVRPVGERAFECVDGEWRGEVIDFPRPGLVRVGVLAERTDGEC
ncbi:MAG: beta-lactamase family protein [Actinomycetota bacterium]|nr:beta-lactamase family protein [Actinomycetota bacterium]